MITGFLWYLYFIFLCTFWSFYTTTSSQIPSFCFLLLCHFEQKLENLFSFVFSIGVILPFLKWHFSIFIPFNCHLSKLECPKYYTHTSPTALLYVLGQGAHILVSVIFCKFISAWAEMNISTTKGWRSQHYVCIYLVSLSLSFPLSLPFFSNQLHRKPSRPGKHNRSWSD